MANQHGTFVRIYALSAPAADVIATMTELRDELYAGGRMTFPADKKVVRPMGGALSLVSAVSSKDIALPPGGGALRRPHGVARRASA